MSTSNRSRGFIRMWRILVLLRTKPRQLDELASMLGVCERTIRRDLEALKRVPLPIESRFPTGNITTRFGIRAALRNEWFVKSMPEWPDHVTMPVADLPR